jgi:hypothetical protein
MANRTFRNSTKKGRLPAPTGEDVSITEAARAIGTMFDWKADDATFRDERNDDWMSLSRR